LPRGELGMCTPLCPIRENGIYVLVCVNAGGQAIPNFYIFRGKRFRQNYIEHCEARATMAMQPRAWMTSYLFSAWISHFLECVRRLGGEYRDFWTSRNLDQSATKQTLA
jgi:hypothetical protein